MYNNIVVKVQGVLCETRKHRALNEGIQDKHCHIITEYVPA